MTTVLSRGSSAETVIRSVKIHLYLKGARILHMPGDVTLQRAQGKHERANGTLPLGLNLDRMRRQSRGLHRWGEGNTRERLQRILNSSHSLIYLLSEDAVRVHGLLQHIL